MAASRCLLCVPQYINSCTTWMLEPSLSHFAKTLFRPVLPSFLYHYLILTLYISCLAIEENVPLLNGHCIIQRLLLQHRLACRMKVVFFYNGKGNTDMSYSGCYYIAFMCKAYFC